MFRNLTISFVLFLVSVMVIADESHAVHVLVYTNETFPIEIVKNDNFVMFYMPWCRHSWQLSPTWEQLAMKINPIEGGQVRIAAVNCETAGSVCTQNHVSRYPTLKYFTAAGITTEYGDDESLELESLESFINSTKTASVPVASTTPITIDQKK